MQKNDEFENFDRTMRELIKVPHDELKSALDAEKREKEEKRKAKKPSASGHAASEKD
jgi:hypothetical protein